MIARLSVKNMEGHHVADEAEFEIRPGMARDVAPQRIRKIEIAEKDAFEIVGVEPRAVPTYKRIGS